MAGQNEHDPESLHVTVVLKNSGHTPADILGGYFGYCIDKIPSIPGVTQGFRLNTPVFLLPGDEIDFGFEIHVEREPRLRGVMIRNGEGPEKLFLVGAVHYEDRFGARHEGGYARVYTGIDGAPRFVFASHMRPAI